MALAQWRSTCKLAPFRDPVHARARNSRAVAVRACRRGDKSCARRRSASARPVSGRQGVRAAAVPGPANVLDSFPLSTTILSSGSPEAKKSSLPACWFGRSVAVLVRELRPFCRPGGMDPWIKFEYSTRFKFSSTLVFFVSKSKLSRFHQFFREEKTTIYIYMLK